jgi:hypothetical protein
MPGVGLLFVVADEAQELHQGALCLEVKVVVLEDIFATVGYLE